MPGLAVWRIDAEEHSAEFESHISFLQVTRKSVEKNGFRH
jgi:hypothetical protein